VLIDDLPEAIADLHRRAEAAGRDPASLPVSVFAFAEPTTDVLQRYREMGIERVVMVSPRRLDDALPFLDRIAPLIADVR
jgi:alkanesulfonate monooxygenase SsuD/methylene tetrahydromethanopterin reductase-like flavin-dependent oxidoreductase (luciferase family)